MVLFLFILQENSIILVAEIRFLDVMKKAK